MDFISEIRLEIDRVENKFDVFLDRIMGIEVDHLDKMVRNIRSMLDSLHNILQQTPAAVLDENQKEMIKYRLRSVCPFISHCKGKDYITSHRTQAMDALRDIEKEMYGILCSLDEQVSKGVVNLGRTVELIFRAEELELIATWLVQEDSSSSTNISVFPIIGMPASGKSSLAYLLFHHQTIKDHFDKRIWVDWKHIYGYNYDSYVIDKIESIYYRNGEETIGYNQNLLIVLDDFLVKYVENWTDKLQPYLSALTARCKPRSKLLVTSSTVEPQLFHRLPLSNKDVPYLLEPFSHDKFLALFQSIAFRGIAQQDRTTHFNKVGIEIFNKFNNADLPVIRFIASILSAQPPHKWHYFNQIVLNIPNPEIHILTSQDQIMQYKEIFDFLLLFPLGFEFSKSHFRHLWDADDKFKQPLKNMFEILLGDETLFECCKTDISGVAVKYKVQVLAYEVAKLLATNKHRYQLVEKYTHNTEFHDPCHISILVNSSWKLYSSDFHLHTLLLLESLFLLPTKSCGLIAFPSISTLGQNLKLKVLDIANNVDCRNSLDSIAKLKELRYLRLGFSSESLPECITDLFNLQTLDLRHSRVRKLPASFHKLENLRHLYVGDSLIDLPPRFGELTKLETLDVFTVGQHNGLDTLVNFAQLVVGKLKIRYREGREAHGILEHAIILQDKKLHELSLEWPYSYATEAAAENYQTEDAMKFELLHPPSTLRILIIKNWKGKRFPKWEMDRFSSLFSNLVFLHIADCNRCTHLPSLSKLGCLKSLELWGLIALEWIENCDDNHTVSYVTPYFPSLEQLSLLKLPMLKGLSRPSMVIDNQYVSHQILPSLHDLRVSYCQELISLPLTPNLQSLEVDNCHGDFLQQFLRPYASPVSSSSASSEQPLLFQSLRSLKLTSVSIPEHLDCLTTLEELSLSWLHDLRILPESIGHLTQLCRLIIRYVPNLEDLPESLAGLFGLEHIEIRYCPRLKQIPRYFSEIVSLQKLKIKECVNLERRCQEPNGEDWPVIKHIRKVHLG